MKKGILLICLICGTLFISSRLKATVIDDFIYLLNSPQTDNSHIYPYVDSDTPVLYALLNNFSTPKFNYSEFSSSLNKNLIPLYLEKNIPLELYFLYSREGPKFRYKIKRE